MNMNQHSTDWVMQEAMRDPTIVRLQKQRDAIIKAMHDAHVKDEAEKIAKELRAEIERLGEKPCC